MKIAFALLLLLHGLIHFMGSAKAFGIADMPQLTQQISKPMGIVWLSAGLLYVSTTIALFAWPERWWLVGAAAVVVSQVATSLSWTDARFGTIANVIARTSGRTFMVGSEVARRRDGCPSPAYSTTSMIRHRDCSTWTRRCSVFR